VARSYPVVLRIAGKAVLVVGGGRVAATKTRSLLAAGAEVTMVAPWFCPESLQLDVVHHHRPYRREDLDGVWLVVTAVDDEAVTAAVAADAAAARVWCNAADRPAHCTVTLPAVHRDGDVTVAVSTGGRSPATASWLRDRIAAQLGDGAGDLVAQVAAARARVRLTRSSEGIDWRSLLDAVARRPRGEGAGEVERFLAQLDPRLGAGVDDGDATTGTLAVVGDGGGDPDELTLRAARALATADVVVHEAAAPAVLALVPDGAELVDLGPDGADPHLVAALLRRLSSHGRAVVRVLPAGEGATDARPVDHRGALHR
jgi:siroheme synthase-like protein